MDLAVLPPEVFEHGVCPLGFDAADLPHQAAEFPGREPLLLEPEQVCAAVIQAMEEERFLILPHPQVLTYMQRKVADYDRWLNGMRRLRDKMQQRAAE